MESGLVAKSVATEVIVYNANKVSLCKVIDNLKIILNMMKLMCYN